MINIKPGVQNIFLILSVVAVCCISSACRKNKSNCHIYYTVKNSSNKAIYFIWNIDSALTLLNYPPGASPAEYKCVANTQKSDSYPGCIEYVINNSSNKMKYIFVFDAQIIETVPWDTVKQNYLLLKRYSLTKAQLDSANWLIDYP